MIRTIKKFQTKATSFIYGLVDPHTGLIRYIGKTSYGAERVRLHWSRRSGGRTYKDNWLRTLSEECEVEVLEEVSKELLCEKERAWISYGREAGWPLTNLTDGGDGLHGHIFSEQHRRAISAALTGRKLSPEKLTAYHEMRRRIGPPRPKGFRMAEEHKEKIRRANQGKYFVSKEGMERTAAVHRRPVLHVSTDTVYPSAKAAADALGLEYSGVAKAASGRYKQINGHAFRYVS